MSTDIMVIDDAALDALAAQAGAEQQKRDFLPQLKINYQEEDENGKELKKGLFFVTGQEVISYAKNVTFRPLTQHFQWIDYDDTNKKLRNRTRLVTSLMGDDEPRDEKGSIKCGKPSQKELKANPALIAKFKEVKCYRQVQGLVSYEGEDVEGNKVKVENVPCALRMKGANFSEFDEEYFQKLGKGRIWDHEVFLKTTKHKNDPSSAAYYYVIHFDDVDLTKRIPVTVDVYNTTKAFIDSVELINKEIDKKYYDALHSNVEDKDAIDSLKSAGSSLLDKDFEDEIPF